MNNIRLTTALYTAAIGVLTIAPAARASEWDKKTIITVDAPIEVPGAVLPAGKYVFKLVNSESDRHIVQVQNERENHTYATILAIPDYRVRPTGKTVFTFWETPAGEPKAVREWFYPGDNFGQEFQYHRKFTQVSQLRQQEQTPAPPAPVAEETPAPQPAVAENTPPPAPEPAPVAETAPAPETTPAPALVAENNTPNVIPQTASNVPLLALLGFGSLGLAVGVKAFASRLS